MDTQTYEESIVIARPPEEVYAMVSDVTRTGQWSPICRECWWDEGAVPAVGAWFTGRNEVPGRTWETRSQVTVAEPDHAFGWEVGQGLVRWHYGLEAVDAGTRLTESWEFLPAGIAFFRTKYGESADAEIASRTDAAHRSIPATLAAIKAIAEG